MVVGSWLGILPKPIFVRFPEWRSILLSVYSRPFMSPSLLTSLARFWRRFGLVSAVGRRSLPVGPSAIVYYDSRVALGSLWNDRPQRAIIVSGMLNWTLPRRQRWARSEAPNRFDLRPRHTAPNFTRFEFVAHAERKDTSWLTGVIGKNWSSTRLRLSWVL